MIAVSVPFRNTSLAWRLVPLVSFWALVGCEPMDGRPAVTVDQLQVQRSELGAGFTRETTALYNVRRVLDADLPVDQRVHSLAVVDRLDGGNPMYQRQVADVLAEAACPPALRQAVLDWLMRRGYADLTGHVVRALSATDDPQLRSSLLDWLARHPSSEVLAEVVKLWAADAVRIDSEAEARYRRVVEMMTGTTWSEALLETLNRPSFGARGSAMEVLAARMPATSLRGRIAAMDPQSDAIRSLQYYLQRFNYLPTQRNELLAAVVVHTAKPRMLDDAAALADLWQAANRYEFNIRDFHLLSRLQRDSTRHLPSRGELVQLLAAAIANRRHTYRPVSGAAARPDAAAEFARHVGDLSMADLVNLHLLDEMLRRSRVQLGLAVMADRDRADRSSQWGGLIFYENGRAEARLYPPGRTGRDQAYVPSDLMLQDAADCLMHFTAHFEKADNAERTGPDPAELAYARDLNCYCVVFTSLGLDAFNATYYNPQGLVVNLGDFTFGGSASGPQASEPAPAGGAGVEAVPAYTVGR